MFELVVCLKNNEKNKIKMIPSVKNGPQSWKKWLKFQIKSQKSRKQYKNMLKIEEKRSKKSKSHKCLEILKSPLKNYENLR